MESRGRPSFAVEVWRACRNAKAPSKLASADSVVIFCRVGFIDEAEMPPTRAVESLVHWLNGRLVCSVLTVVSSAAVVTLFSFLGSWHPNEATVFRRTTFPPTKPENPQFSTVKCVGGEPNDRTCVLRNVCFDGHTSRWKYFLGDRPRLSAGTTNSFVADQDALRQPLAFIRRHSAPGVAFPVDVVNASIPFSSEGALWLPPDEPSDTGTSPAEDCKALGGLHYVLHTTGWAENLGHFIGDDLFAIWNAFELLGLPYIPACVRIILGKNPLEPFSGAMRDRAEGFMRYFFPVMASQDEPCTGECRGWIPPHLGVSPFSVNEGLTCVSRLVIGTSKTGMFFRADRSWSRFMNFLVQQVGLENVTPIQRQVLFFPKRGRRSMVNFEQTVQATANVAASRGWQLEVYDPFGRPMEEQITKARQSAVIVTPCGGTSFGAAFAAPGSSVLIFGFYNNAANGPDRMESFVWDWEWRMNVFNYGPRVSELRWPVCESEGFSYFFAKGSPPCSACTNSSTTRSGFLLKRPEDCPLRVTEYEVFRHAHFEVDLARYADQLEAAIEAAEESFQLQFPSKG